MATVDGQRGLYRSPGRVGLAQLQGFGPLHVQVGQQGALAGVVAGRCGVAQQLDRTVQVALADQHGGVFPHIIGRAARLAGVRRHHLAIGATRCDGSGEAPDQAASAAIAFDLAQGIGGCSPAGVQRQHLQVGLGGGIQLATALGGFGDRLAFGRQAVDALSNLDQPGASLLVVRAQQRQHLPRQSSGGPMPTGLGCAGPLELTLFERGHGEVGRCALGSGFGAWYRRRRRRPGGCAGAQQPGRGQRQSLCCPRSDHGAVSGRLTVSLLLNTSRLMSPKIIVRRSSSGWA